ncbi:MAG: glycosyltransferase family 2 protein [Fimbriimonadaceae bacterium]|nr:glycosyltransferase family 2 protein [Fimbriimonadaceae bacterium]
MLSVLVVNWNTRDKLQECLASLSRHGPSFPYEVIVVDNASTDGSAAMVRNFFPDVRLVEPGGNTGYARGNNIAFGLARYDWLLTLNPDTVFRGGELEAAVRTLAAEPTYGALALQLRFPSGEVQRSVRGFPTPLGVLGAALGIDRLAPASPLAAYTLPLFDYAVEQPGPQPMGTFLLFRKAALAAVGDPARPFDEDFPIFFNEVDLLKRMADAGWPCLYSPRAWVGHHHGSSTSQARKSMIWESHTSLTRYFHKHLAGADRLWLPAVVVANWVGAFVRAKGFYRGFRPERDHLQLEHDR